MERNTFTLYNVFRSNRFASRISLSFLNWCNPDSVKQDPNIHFHFHIYNTFFLQKFFLSFPLDFTAHIIFILINKIDKEFIYFSLYFALHDCSKFALFEKYKKWRERKEKNWKNNFCDFWWINGILFFFAG